ncbi:hypothetical protein AWN90_19095 [Nocardia terpenica]|uniref:Uncharacterized protein n=2 Tax=Nocardia terpenica TaxID=455432 RepID=A0A164PF77_9NOCA|nr:hypothetical protein AWN90_19095 [Nocardia terpenica]
MPDDVRRQINLAVREDNRRKAVEYQSARTKIEAAVRDHQHNMLVGYRPRCAETHDTWFTRQQQLGKQRLAIEQAINAEPRLTTEDRGQAVAALSVAHHAPSTPALPVFTPHPPTGLQALRARVQAKLAQWRAGQLSDKQRRMAEAWEQVHRERREQAQRLAGPEAAETLDLSRALGLHDHGVWLSRDTHTQQQAQIGELEATVQTLRTEKDQLAQTVAELTARLDQLVRPTANQAPSEQQQKPPERQQPSTDQVKPDPAAPENPVVGETETLSTDSALPADETPAETAESDKATADLIGAAHPNFVTPQPKPTASTQTTAEHQHVVSAPSAGDGLDI